MLHPGGWFLLGDSAKGYSNTTFIEMAYNLIVVDPNHPGQSHELPRLLSKLSTKPVKYSLDTHAHGDHSYGNSVWIWASATSIAFVEVLTEMNRTEPSRWRANDARRKGNRETYESVVERPKKMLDGHRFVPKNRRRDADFLFMGWGHTPGDGYILFPKEHVLATGDAAANGPCNKLLEAWIRHWPKIVEQRTAFHPEIVQPGHKPSGGQKLLIDQLIFRVDFYNAVEVPAKQGRALAQMTISLPEANRNWIPKDLSQDIEATHLEMRGRVPARLLPHELK